VKCKRPLRYPGTLLPPHPVQLVPDPENFLALLNINSLIFLTTLPQYFYNLILKNHIQSCFVVLKNEQQQKNLMQQEH